LRLDAVGSAGMGLSREKFAGMVKAGDVRVNYEVEKKPARVVKEGDVVNIPGMKKLVIGEISVNPKSGRFRIYMQRFV